LAARRLFIFPIFLVSLALAARILPATVHFVVGTDEPVGLMWAADSLLAVDDWLTASYLRRLAAFEGHALIGLLALAFCMADVTGTFLVPAPLEYKALGEWMATHHVGQGEGVMARKRQAPFYAHARWEWLPLANTEGMLDYAASHRAQYVVIDERTVPALRPELAYLLDARAAPTVFIRLFRESALLPLRHKLIVPHLGAEHAHQQARMIASPGLMLDTQTLHGFHLEVARVPERGV
jgi:hypothetical protein